MSHEKGLFNTPYSKPTTRLCMLGVTVKLKGGGGNFINKYPACRFSVLKNLNNFKLEQPGGRLPKENGSVITAAMHVG